MDGSKLEQVVNAIESAEISWKMRLTRLVDGVETYELVYSDGTRLEFDNTDDAYEHIAQTKRLKAARAAIRALLGPTKAMVDAAYAAADAYEAGPAPRVWCGLSSAFNAMIEAALEEGLTASSSADEPPQTVAT
ncbi:hypothetical protein [Rhodopseudomonas sp. AAP120]|uniref:hypothetical protein n=1 Tax=Rhodopseudomonas sp. AAP120 TaxID=1523430 RepID=UPI000A60D5F7|nr:hypothetical protein [Rhodopseudomonas sp. AAP120]